MRRVRGKYHNSAFSVLAIIVLGASLSACASAPQIAADAAPKGDYILDPTHTSVLWSLSHAGLSNYTARFDDVSGALSFDPQNPQNSKLDIIIQADSVNTGLPKFDATIANQAKYFNAKQYPQIRYVSDQITKTSPNSGTAKGNLTFRGITKPVTLDVIYNGAGKSFGHAGKTLGFSANGEFLRSEFGLTTLTNFGIGDKVTLRIETEFNQGKSQ